MSTQKKIFTCHALMLLLVLSFTCRKASETGELGLHSPYVLRGRAFGTQFTVKFFVGDKRHHSSQQQEVDIVLIQKKIETVLLDIDASMSNWRQDSEITRFNDTWSTKPFPVSKAFYTVIKSAKNIYKLSRGAFDPASEPLFSLWGFTPSKIRSTLPSEKEIRQGIRRSGMHSVHLFTLNHQDKSSLKKTRLYYLQKKKPELKLNVSALAKGYGVDRLAYLIKEMGFHSFMVEIGGEVRTGKGKPNGDAWSIAIERPHYDGKRSIFRIADLKEKSMASSGNYRNYYTIAKKKYPHIVDPRSGYPVKQSIVAVTIIGPYCMIADALATSLMVLNVSQGKALLKKFHGYEALWLLQTKEKNTYISSESKNMQSYWKK